MSGMTRADFLKAVAVGVAASAVPPGAAALVQEPAAQGALTVEELELVMRAANLTFNRDDLTKVLGAVNRARGAYPGLRDAVQQESLMPGMAWKMVEATALPKEPKVSLRVRKVAPPLSGKESDLSFMSVVELAALLRAKRLTSVDLTTHFLSRLERYGDKLLCVINLCTERAMADARRADQEAKQGKSRGLLHGIPYGVKDLFDVKGYPSTWGCKTFESRTADSDSDVVASLARAGAVVCAKLSMGALAQGDVWWKGKTQSPWDKTIGSSGSSAGSASTVAAGLLPFAIGTETSGSIVSPSHNCRVTGLRPSFGSVARGGAMALSWSMDKVGPICRNAEDCAVVLAAMLGPSDRDPSALARGFVYNTEVDVRKLKVGYLVTQEQDLQKPVDPASKPWLQAMADLGAFVTPVFLPEGFPGMQAILNAECAASFEAFTRSDAIQELETYSSWPNTFRAARAVPAVEYIQADRARRAHAEAFRQALDPFDVVVADDRVYPRVYQLNITGHPQILVPFGVDERGRARSFSLIGKAWSEPVLCSVAWSVQKKTGYHLLRPEMEIWD